MNFAIYSFTLINLINDFILSPNELTQSSEMNQHQRSFIFLNSLSR